MLNVWTQVYCNRACLRFHCAPDGPMIRHGDCSSGWTVLRSNSLMYSEATKAGSLVRLDCLKYVFVDVDSECGPNPKQAHYQKRFTVPHATYRLHTSPQLLLTVSCVLQVRRSREVAVAESATPTQELLRIVETRNRERERAMPTVSVVGIGQIRRRASTTWRNLFHAARFNAVFVASNGREVHSLRIGMEHPVPGCCRRLLSLALNETLIMLYGMK